MRELLIMDDSLSNLTVDSKLLQESATSKKIEEYPLISMCTESSFLEKECLDQKDGSNCEAWVVQRELQESSVLVHLDTTQHENIKKSLVTCGSKELRHCTIQSPGTIHREVKLLSTVEMQCSEEEEREVKCKEKFHEGIECPPKCTEGKDHSSGYVSQCVANSSSKEVVEEQANSSESSSESSSGQETPHCRTELKDINPFKLLEEEKNQNHMRYLLQNLPDLAKYFNLHKKIGVGTFSSVFLGSLKDSVIQRFPELKDRKFAIKHLVPVLHPRRIARELKYLHQIGGKDNVIGVDLSLRNGDCVVFIMPYLCHKRFSDYVLDMDASETRDYMRNLMIALKRVHSFNVIHRDVKPSNFLYNRELKRYLLVDFGLSQNVHPQAKLTTEDRERKRKRQEENSNENVRKLDSSTTISNSRTKKIALQPRAKEENVVQGSNGTSQPIKRIKLYEQSSRGQKMIEHLFQQQNTLENKRIPLSSKVVNQRNTLTETFRLPYSSPKANSKNGNVKKKLFSPNSENNSPKEMKPSIKGVSPIPPNPPGLLTQSRAAQINMEPLKSSSLMSLTNMENHTSSMGTSLQNELSRQKFQTLEPRPCKNGNQTGSTVLRVQNSQVKSQTMKPLSPLESERQRKMLFTSQKNRKLSQLLEEPKCFCKGKPHVCSVCLKHKTIPAPRAGTPGFRPPEVLLKYPMQTTAVDMWAAGVIMLCILSGCCPFFRSPDDITGLAEIMTIFGTEQIKEVAKRLGRIVHCSNNKPPLNLRKLCERLRRRRKDKANGIIDVINSLPICPKCENTIESELEGCLCLKPDSGTCSGEFPSSAYDLLHRLLDPNPVTRITAEEALQHSFLKEY